MGIGREVESQQLKFHTGTYPPGRGRNGQKFTYPIGEKKSTQRSENKKRGTRARKHGRGEQSCFPEKFYGWKNGQAKGKAYDCHGE